ncbi:MAG: hypothetical protein JWR10_4118, partial [Rubritepida sp.]|nr:hypothetical protein [Rubritepida sp.]
AAPSGAALRERVGAAAARPRGAKPSPSEERGGAERPRGAAPSGAALRERLGAAAVRPRGAEVSPSGAARERPRGASASAAPRGRGTKVLRPRGVEGSPPEARGAAGRPRGASDSEERAVPRVLAGAAGLAAGARGFVGALASLRTGALRAGLLLSSGVRAMRWGLSYPMGLVAALAEAARMAVAEITRSAAGTKHQGAPAVQHEFSRADAR